MTLRLCKKLLKEEKGATLVEFAIVGLLFFTILFGVIDFSILLFNQQIVTNAGREGARFGIVARPDDYKITKNSIEQKVRDYAESNIISFGAKNFSVDADFNSGLSFCKEFRDRLTVNVSYSYAFLFLPFGPLPLGTTSVMVCE